MKAFLTASALALTVTAAPAFAQATNGAAGDYSVETAGGPTRTQGSYHGNSRSDAAASETTGDRSSGSTSYHRRDPAVANEKTDAYSDPARYGNNASNGRTPQ
jgi:hypothetical protein